jgi:hypothetical protein
MMDGASVAPARSLLSSSIGRREQQNLYLFSLSLTLIHESHLMYRTVGEEFAEFVDFDEFVELVMFVRVAIKGTGTTHSFSLRQHHIVSPSARPKNDRSLSADVLII